MAARIGGDSAMADQQSIPAKKTILIADDDPTVVATLTTYLESLGYEVISAADGETAMDMIEEMKPDLLVLDIAMPKASGIVLARQIRSHSDRSLRQLPIIMLTAKSDPRHQAYSDEAGVDAFIAKPVPLPQLAEKIRQLLEKGS